MMSSKVIMSGGDDVYPVETVLEIRGLHCAFQGRDGLLPVVEDLSLTLVRGETLCLVGESGCGKTITALAILGLLPRGAGILEGIIRLEGRDLIGLAEAELRRLRGLKIGMIFQEPMTSLNPLLRVETQISESMRHHLGLSRDEARGRALALMREVGIPDPESRFRSYPHELSGGLRQRVMIAIALACEPLLLIADEPTTALDVTIQAQILQLLKSLGKKRGLATLLISHDLGIVSEMADRVMVMYAGQVVESAPAASLLGSPRHPYTRGLLASLPRVDRRLESLVGIEGRVPPPGECLTGCRFRDRCHERRADCSRDQTLDSIGPDHLVRCHLVER